MTYIIGDVHGEFKMLLKLMELIPKNSRVVFVGDTIDRGLYSKDVTEFIKNNKFECVMGNHEYMMIKAIEHIFKQKSDVYFSSYPWFYHGGKQTLISYEINPNISQNELNKKEKDRLKKVIEYFKTLPLYIELGMVKNGLHVVVSHAFIGDHWNRKDEKSMFANIALWSTEMRHKEPNIFNIFGHTPQKDVLVTDDYVDVDTGCGFGKKLSAYCVETGEVLSVEK